MPQRCPNPEARPVGVSAARPLSWANLVGRDGIEPPTLRFQPGWPYPGPSGMIRPSRVHPA
jgi:hypothetical protein